MQRKFAIVSKNLKSQVKEHIGVLFLFVVLTLILTYPVITRLTTHTAGDGGDGFQFMWNIWHVNKVLTGGEGIKELYYTDYQYYPHGTSLAFSTLSLTNTLFIAFPLTLITNNLVLIYNILFLLSFILSGYSMYLLVRYLVKDRTIAFWAGFAYSFSPLHMAWGLGYLNLMSMQWTPFFFLFFFKMFEEQKMRNAIIAAIFLFFLTLADWQHLLFAFFIAAPYFVYRLISSPSLLTPAFFARTALLLVLFGIAIWPFVTPLISEYLGEGEYYVTSFYTAITPFDYILPNRFHPLWGESQPTLAEGSERGASLGYLVLFISLLYLAKARKHFFWFLLAMFFLFLSLAPHFEATSSFFKSIPVFKPLYHMGRFSFGVMFSFILLFAFALKRFLPAGEQLINKKFSFPRKGIRAALAGSIFIVLTIEYLAVPYPTTYKYRRAEVEFAGEIGQAVRGPHPALAEDFTVLALPLDISTNNLFFRSPILLYFQTFHEKKIIGGYVGRVTPASGQTLAELRDIIIMSNVAAFREFLKNYKVGYIILHNGWIRNEKIYENISFLLGETPLKLITVFPSAEISIFEVLPEKHINLIPKVDSLNYLSLEAGSLLKDK